jgi:hypothetical protein
MLRAYLLALISGTQSASSAILTRTICAARPPSICWNVPPGAVRRAGFPLSRRSLSTRPEPSRIGKSGANQAVMSCNRVAASRCSQK